MTQTIGPVNQRGRIAALRVVFGGLVASMFFAAPVRTDSRIVFEVLEVFGAGMLVAAVLGRFWATMFIGDRKNGLVLQSGPYAVCRHPLYAFSILGATGAGLMLESLVYTVLFGVAATAVLYVTARKEEAYLDAMFGPAYQAYAARVPMLLPRQALAAMPAELTVSLPRLRDAGRDSLVFLAFIPLSETIEGLQRAALYPVFPIW
jgi:protein-S-isoprenylcysteine O-methyltransferase Ste14